MSNLNHEFSVHLSPEDKNVIIDAIGARSQCLSAGIAQLFQSTNHQNRTWEFYGQGAILFVRDARRKGFFFELVDLDQCQKIWDHELYSEMKLKSPSDSFHMFEVENGIVGISFAFHEEGILFAKAVNERIKRRQLRRDASNQMSIDIPESQSTIVHNVNVPRNAIRARQQVGGQENRTSKKRPRLTKRDIGLPSNFRHVGGVISSAEGFQMLENTEGMDPKILKFLSISGVKTEVLQDSNQREKIMNFVKQHDVVDLVNKKSAKDPDSGSVLSSDTNLKSRNRSSSRRRVENKRHQVGQPPKPPAPNLSIVQTSLSGPPPPPAPPGPPPPPPMPLNLPPTIPMQIERPKTSVESPHGSLMEEIRNKGGAAGARLKSVDALASKKDREDEDLLKALMEGLEKINIANHISDTDESETNEDAESWSDEV